MNKTEFIAKFATEIGTTKKEAKEIYECFVSLIKRAVIEDGEVSFSDFIKIEKVHKDARECINPATGEKMTAKAKDVPKVRCLTKFKREVETGIIEG